MSSPFLPANAAWVGHLPQWMYPNLLTFKQPTVTTSATGFQTKGTPVAVDGLTDIPCRKAPITLIRPEYQDNRTPTVTDTDEQVQVTVRGYYPDAKKWMLAEIDGVLYDIIGIEPNGEKTLMRMRVELVTT